MAVQIDMEMPECCRRCRLLQDVFGKYICIALPEEDRETVMLRDLDKRPFWCPLKEVK